MSLAIAFSADVFSTERRDQLVHQLDELDPALRTEALSLLGDFHAEHVDFVAEAQGAISGPTTGNIERVTSLDLQLMEHELEEFRLMRSGSAAR